MLGGDVPWEGSSRRSVSLQAPCHVKLRASTGIKVALMSASEATLAAALQQLVMRDWDIYDALTLQAVLENDAGFARALAPSSAMAAGSAGEGAGSNTELRCLATCHVATAGPVDPTIASPEADFAAQRIGTSQG